MKTKLVALTAGAAFALLYVTKPEARLDLLMAALVVAGLALVYAHYKR